MPVYEILTDESAVAAIAGEWRQLQSRTGGGAITDSERFLVWWDSIGRTHASRSLHIVVGREGTRLVALLPLTLIRRKGVRLLQAEAGIVPECDVLCENPADTAGLWQAARQSPYYDFARIKGVYPQTPCEQMLDSFAVKRDSTEFFYLNNNWPSDKEWLASLSGNTRGNFNRCKRRLEEKGTLRFEIYQGGSPFPHKIVEDMVRQKVKLSELLGKQAPYDHPDVHVFFTRLIETATRQNTLFLAWLKCGEVVIAYNMGIISQGVLHAPFWTYDPDWSRYSPSNVAMVNTIGWVVNQRLKRINFMYTTDNDSQKFFKRKYSNEIYTGYEYSFSASAKGRALETAFFALRGIKRRISALKSNQQRRKTASPDTAES